MIKSRSNRSLNLAGPLSSRKRKDAASKAKAKAAAEDGESIGTTENSTMLDNSVSGGSRRGSHMRSSRQGSNRSLMGNSSVGSHSRQIASLWDSHSSLPLVKMPTNNNNTRRNRRRHMSSSMSHHLTSSSSKLKPRHASGSRSLDRSAQSEPTFVAGGRRRERYEREYDKVYYPNNPSRFGSSAKPNKATRRRSSHSSSRSVSGATPSVVVEEDDDDGLAGKVRQIESHHEIRMKKQGAASKFLDHPDGMYLRVEEDGLPASPGRDDGSVEELILMGDSQHNWDEPLLLDMIIEVPSNMEDGGVQEDMPPPLKPMPEEERQVAQVIMEEEEPTMEMKEAPVLDVVMEDEQMAEEEASLTPLQESTPMETNEVDVDELMEAPSGKVSLEEEEEEEEPVRQPAVPEELILHEVNIDENTVAPTVTETSMHDSIRDLASKLSKDKKHSKGKHHKARKQEKDHDTDHQVASNAQQPQTFMDKIKAAKEVARQNKKQHEEPETSGAHDELRALASKLTKGKDVKASKLPDNVARQRLESDRVAQAQLDAVEQVRRLKAAKLAKKQKKKAAANGAHQNVRDLADKLAKVRQREAVC